jgi:hypothetical protein
MPHFAANVIWATAYWNVMLKRVLNAKNTLVRRLRDLD